MNQLKPYKMYLFNIETQDGATLEVADEFKYLVTLIGPTASEMKLRKALKWKALHCMKGVWMVTDQ